MTRDDLISATRQLIDEGDRLRANPSLASLQMWLQRSDDLLATAWGSMDRYHLAWLLVGKPKAIVRGRPMTPDEEAAYVREVAEQKTAALRMSLDAVERQGMPFVGETGGVGPGGDADARTAGGPRAGPDRPADRPGPHRAAGRSTPRGRRPSRPRGPARPATRPDAAVTELVPAVGGQRSVPAADPVARDYILLGLRLDQHIPGLVDGYFGPAELKATVDLEQLRSPARLRDDAWALRERLAGEVADPARRAWLDAQLVALETQAGALAGDALPYLEHVARCFAYAPPRRPDAEFDAAAARIGELLPGTTPVADRLAAWNEAFEVPVDRLPGVVDWLVGRLRAVARDALRPARRARTCGSRS